MAGWDYEYWRSKLSKSTDEEFGEVYQEFLDAGWDGLKHPPKTSCKDELVERLILKKKKTGVLLVVGSWDAYFAFRMASLGFHMTGIDCCKRAIKLAEEAKSTLPPEIANRCKFQYGLAEHLEEHPQYDITTNFCLEHVRDPKQVVAENLKHLKLDGYAYFTPPIGHGTDSPTHLHHFEEQDLRDMLPSGFGANIHQVKYKDDSPHPNCFVVEVFHKSLPDKV